MDGSASKIMPSGTPSCLSPAPSPHEPSMHVPRPSSDRAQDVSHILASVFQDLYTRNVLAKDTVKNLIHSSEGSSKYHKKCMDQLNKVHREHQRVLDNYDEVEKHIIQARARAASADVKALNRATGEMDADAYGKLGLPPVTSSFRECVDEEQLLNYNLIIPSQLFHRPRHTMDLPRKSKQPHYLLPTMSSSIHFSKEKLDDGYADISDLVKNQQQKAEEEEDDEEEEMTTLSSDSGDRCSVPPRLRIRSRDDSVTSPRNRWRDQMRHNTRVDDRKLLAKLEARHNFLKNPRFLPLTDPKGVRLLTKGVGKVTVAKGDRFISEDVPPPEFQVFMPCPSVVLFNDWTVGRVYEAVLELRNVSGVSRHVRVLPPKSTHFSLGLGKFPGSEGRVAPGMSAHFNVRFMPDALSEYHDQVEVLSQATGPLIVPIVGRRTPPVLTLEETLQCGYCLVGGVKLTELTVKNHGGSGRFCVMNKSSWPASNFKTVVNPAGLEVGPFQIRPAVFEVLSGEAVTVELIFAPHASRVYREDLLLICDNCQVKSVTIEGCGEPAAVELVSVSEGDVEEPKVGEIVDLTANHLIRFPPLNPHSFYMKQLIVHNSTNVDMPYQWHVLKPNLCVDPRFRQQGAAGQAGEGGKYDFYPDDESPFFIEPRGGVLQPNGIHEFVLTFAPRVVQDYCSVLHLVLSDIPDMLTDGHHSNAVLQLGNGNGLHHNGNGTREEGVARLATPPNKSRAANQPIQYREVIALEIEVKGQSIPYQVMLHPPAVIVPGTILVGATVRRPLQMANYSLAPARFVWVSETSPNIIEVEPPVGVIQPGEVAELDVTVTGSAPGPLSSCLLCHIEYHERPIQLHVQAQIAGPTVVIDDVALNYGLIKLGQSVRRRLHIRNTTQLTAKWRLSVADPDHDSEFTLTPSSGELKSLEKREITVQLQASRCRTLVAVLNLEVEGSNGSSVACHAEVQLPQACFVESILVVKDAYISVPCALTATLVNQTLFPTRFEFGSVQGKHADGCAISVSPRKGELEPRAKLDVTVCFSANKVGEINDVYLPCKIFGAEKPLVLGFFAKVLDLEVKITTPDFRDSKSAGVKQSGTEQESDAQDGGMEEEPLQITFGHSMQMKSNPQERVVMTNMSAIRAHWRVTTRYFAAPAPEPKQTKPEFHTRTTRRAMLGRTPNLADPLSKTPAQLKTEKAGQLLREGNGLAFEFEPASGVLEPYQSKDVVVTAYASMWGRYDDIMTVNIAGLPPREIPITVNVVGWPLSFQISQCLSGSVVRYGTHLNGGAPVRRKLRINNSSFHDIRLDWRTFNLPAESDRKLIDLNMWFGDSFPLRDTSGGGSRRSADPVPSTHVHSFDALLESSEEDEREIMTGEEEEDRRPKIVSVRIEPHLGVVSDQPYHMEPEQIVVPAHGNVFVTSVFEPVYGTIRPDQTEQECNAFALGYMSLDDPATKRRGDQILREDGYGVAPLRLSMTSTVRHGLLHIEEDDGEFHLALSDVINRHGEFASKHQVRPFILSNTGESTMAFKLVALSPFFLLADGGKKVHCLPRLVLSSHSNIKVAVGFNASTQTMLDLDVLRSGKTLEGAALETYGNFDVEQVVYESAIRVEFATGALQQHRVRAVVSVPQFRIAEHRVDFGVCFVGQMMSRDLVIENVGAADCHWSLSESEPKHDPVRTGAIQFQPDCGVLEAFVSHVSKKRDVITVYFTARSESATEATFELSGRLGERSHFVKVTGSGSYDGMHELK